MFEDELLPVHSIILQFLIWKVGCVYKTECHDWLCNHTTTKYSTRSAMFGKSAKNHWSLLGAKWCHHAVVEALSPHWIAPSSTPNVQKVIDKHYMQWMGIWSPHCAVTTKWTRFGKSAEIIDHCWVPNDIPSCSHRGSHPTWNDSHNQSKHIKGDWQTLYAVDEDMKPLSCCYCTTLMRPDLESQLKIIDHFWVPNDTSMQSQRLSNTLNDSHNQAKHIKGDWQRLYASCCYHHTCGTIVGLDLESQLKSWITAGCQMIPSCSCWGSKPHMEWFPYPLQTYKRWLTSIHGSGWGCGAPIMLLPTHLWDWT